MFAKFSVRKPYTILVAVVLILVLGVVSVTRMVPDLLPEMEMPYILLFTSYAGASPEEVEEKVTKPIEQQMAQLSNLNSMNSTSAENYSLVMLEFTDQVNMDAITIDIREGLDRIEDAWDDFIGTTSILKISPDIIPTTVAAVNRDGYDRIALSSFVTDTLQPRLEGVEGVAAINTTGLVVENVEVTIDEEKLATLNERLYDAITGEFSDAFDELADARAEIEEGEQAIAEGYEKIDQGKAQIAGGSSQAEAGFQAARDKLAQTEAGLTALLAGLMAQRTDAADQLDAILTQEQGINGQLSQLAQLHASEQAFQLSFASIDANADYTPEQKETYKQALMNSPEYLAMRRGLDAFASNSVTEASLNEQLAALEVLRRPLEATLAGLDTTIDQTNDGLSEIAAGYAKIAGKEDETDKALANAAAALRSGQATLEQTEAEIAGGKEQLASAEEQVNEQLDKALEQVDLNTILSKETVAALINAQNFAMPAGYAVGGEGNVLVNVGDKLYGLEELKTAPLLYLELGDIGTITVDDVATVERLNNAGDNYARINGEDGVLLSFTKQSTYATATVAESIGARFARLEQEYPGLTFVKLMDQGDYIQMAVGSVVENLLIGGILAILILLLFLRDIRPTFIVALSIPISLLFALVLMYFSGVTMNLLSMAGLAIGIGMLVDNSIVVIENTYRLRAMGVPVKEAAIDGARQVAGAITASTLTTVCVFLPIVFVQGLTRQLFTDMALTIAYSLLASLIVAITLIPALSGWMFKKPVRQEGRGTRRLQNGMNKALAWTLKHRALCLILAVVLLGASAAASLSRGFSYLPESGGTQVSVNLTLGEDATYEEATALSDEVLDAIAKVDGVTDAGAMLSSGMASVIGMGGADSGADASAVTIYVLLDEQAGHRSKATRQAIADALVPFEGRCETSIAGMTTMDYSSVMGGSGIVVNLYGSDLDDMRQAARQIADALSGVEGVDTADDGIGETAPALHIAVDREKAAKYGLTVAQAYAQISAKLSASTTATTLSADDKSLTVSVISGADANVRLDDIRGMELTSTAFDGTETSVKLYGIATFTDTESLAEISRENQRRVVSVTAAIADGYNVTKVSDDAKAALDGLTLPAGCTLVYEGENESILSALSDLLFMLALAILIIYLIMVAQFQSLLSPFIVMFTIPLAFTGGFLALLIAGMEVSIVAMVGMIMLVGIVVHNGIVLIDCINQLVAEGMEPHEAIMAGVRMRLRPVLMTALTTILGLLPLALGLGTGVETVQPVAVVCIGGLVYATVTTLFIVPILYDVFRRKRGQKAAVPQTGAPAPAENTPAD